MNQDLMTKARQLKSKYEVKWMDLEDVVAVGIGMIEGKPGIIVSVKGNVDSIRQKIPAEIDGIQIDLIESGEIKAG